MKRTLLLASLFGVTHLLFGQYVDDAFNPIILNYPKIDGSALQEDGKLIIAGEISRINGIAIGRVDRLNVDGTLDESFNPPLEEIGDTYINHISIFGDSVIILSSNQGKMFVLNSDGTLNHDFDEITSYGTPIKAIKINDGFLLTSFEGGVAKINKFDLNGHLDMDFSPLTSNGQGVYDAIVLSDNKIILVGEFTQINGESHNNIVKINADGTIDDTFNVGTGANASINEIDIDNDENLYLIGYFNDFNSTVTNGIIKLKTDGSKDNTFQVNNLLAKISTNALDLTLIDDDSLIIVSRVGNGIELLKTDLNGALSNTFSEPSGNSGFGLEVTVHDQNNSLLVIGRFNNFNQQDIHGISTLNYSGEILTNNSILSSNPHINNAAIQDDNKLLITGDFHQINGQDAKGIARLNEDGSVDNFAYQFEASADVRQIDQLQNGGILVLNDGGMLWLNEDGSLNETITANYSNLFCFKELNDGNILLGGTFESIDGSLRRSLAMINPMGAIVSDFNTGNLFLNKSNSFYIYAIDTLFTGDIAVGGYDSDEGTGFMHIISKDGSAILNSISGINESINTINTRIENKVFFSGFYSNSPTGIYQRDYTGAISGSDIQITSEDANTDGIITTNDNSIVIGGRFKNVANIERVCLAKISYDGVVDEGFILNVEGGERPQVRELVKLNNETAYVVGNFNKVAGSLSTGIARIKLMDSIPIIKGLISPINIEEDNNFNFSLNDLEYHLKGNELDEVSLVLIDAENYSLENNQIIPDANFYGTLNLSAQINSPIGTAAPFPFTIEVLPVNDVPIISDQTEVPQINEDNSYAIALNQLEIEDPDNLFPDDFTLEILPGSDYTFEGLTISPSENFFGDLNVNLKIEDLESESEIFIFNITVLPVNDIPVITGHSVSTEINEDNPLEITLNQLDIVDPDDQFPDNFTLEIQSGLNYTITESSIIPNTNYFGPIDISIKVDDGEALSEVFTISIDVLAVNDAPVISDQLSTPEIEEDNSVMIAISDLEVLDPDNQFPADFSMQILEGQNYSFEGFTITPEEHYNGNLTVNLKVNDGVLDSETFPYSILITPFNDAPIILSQLESPSIIQGIPYELSTALFNIFDPDNSTGELTFSVSVGENYTVSGNTITPDITYTGELNVPVTISDGQLLSDEFLASFEVREPLGLSDISLLQVYPNPAHETLLINIPSGIQKGEIELINLSGKQVHFQYFQGSEDISIDVSGLTAGFYILKLATGFQIFTGKVLIKSR